jgi:mRNA-degrading endonuclease RelE of RelBE toxin-antitoxin system
MHYRLLISIEVVEFLEKLPSRVRVPLRRAIEEIGEIPSRWPTLLTMTTPGGDFTSLS